jgi:uncharacterized protein (TIGR02599 family)
MLVILIGVSSVINMVSSTYRRTMGASDSFESARTAFDTMARIIRQATLNSYLGYDHPDSPGNFQLKSDLQFVVGPQKSLDLGVDADSTGADNSFAVFFQAPLGTADTVTRAHALLVSTGFLIVHSDDPLRPTILENRVPQRHRYRLYQFIEPREESSIYSYTITDSNGVPIPNDAYRGYDWFSKKVKTRKSIHPLAENVIGLVIWPVYEGRPEEHWNSRDANAANSYNRLPQALEMALAVIDEASAVRLEESQNGDLMADLFTTPSSFVADLQKLEKRMAELHLNYRIFRTTLPLDASNTRL